MPGVILDRKAPDAVKENLKNMRYEVVESLRLPILYDAISSHPDIQICCIAPHQFVAAPEVYDYYAEKLKNCVVLKGKTSLKGTYPHDIAYNVAVSDTFAIHNLPYTDPMILEELAKEHKTLYHVKQGYSRCNCVCFPDGSLITSDPSIANLALLNDLSCLKIQNSKTIALKGFPYGFFGGACGFLRQNTLAICGNIKNHPDYLSIESFCLSHGISLKCLYDGHILDVGSILYF